MRVWDIHGRRAAWGVARAVMLVCALMVMVRGRARAQETPPEPAGQAAGKEVPDSPGESKKDNANPAQQVEDKTKQALDMTKDVAQVGFVKARDWESGWIAGIYVGKNRKLVPMTRQQREDYYLHQTFTTPEAYMKRMFAALVDQARGVPAWQGGIGGYAERFASREGQFFTSNSLAALGNAKLGYEVRYDKCKCSDFRHRMRHAIMRNFLTYDRSEENLRPQFALYGGAFGGGLMATAWKPSPKNAWVNGGWAVLGQAAYGSLVNLITEFGTEINAKQGVK
ncbi:MAG: hypothetical protein WCC37_21770 [Candidatus Sulfotelmatobacter sp.]|jgi:hypothetical protein